MQHQEVIDFWFSLPQEKWWQKDPKFDQEIAIKFAGLHNNAINNSLKDWEIEPYSALAEIIILDQFSRNMFRDSKQEYVYDSLAQDKCLKAIEIGHDKNLDEPLHKGFMYMPLMHSEKHEHHELALELFSIPGLEDMLKYEILHKKIIDRFGRYPHRNDSLGRKSTQEELEFLKEPNSNF